MATVQMKELWASRLPNFEVLSNPASPCCRITCAPSATASCTNFTTSALVLKTSREGLSPSPKSGPRFDPETLRLELLTQTFAMARMRCW